MYVTDEPVGAARGRRAEHVPRVGLVTGVDRQPGLLVDRRDAVDGLRRLQQPADARPLQVVQPVDHLDGFVGVALVSVTASP